MDKDAMKQARALIQNSRNIVFFGGAGVSTASNIPDFRSANGLYNRETGTAWAPEEILSLSFFMTHPDEYYQFHRKNLNFPDAQPNAVHIALAELEKQGKLTAVITQNIDGLHQKAGSHNVIELHGNMNHYYCLDCGFPAQAAEVMAATGVPRCSHCGGIIRPDVVLYEETLDPEVVESAVLAISSADVLLIGGTSLVVYPAAGFLRYYHGDRMILVNREPIPFDDRANFVFHGDLSQILYDLTSDD